MIYFTPSIGVYDREGRLLPLCATISDGRDSMAKRKLTAKKLGKILHEEFKRDQWGDVAPSCFRDPQKASSDDEMAGLYEVLDRAAERIEALFVQLCAAPFDHLFVKRKK